MVPSRGGSPDPRTPDDKGQCAEIDKETEKRRRDEHGIQLHVLAPRGQSKATGHE